MGLIENCNVLGWVDLGFDTSRVESEQRSLQKISSCAALQAGTPDPPHENAAHFREDPGNPIAPCGALSTA